MKIIKYFLISLFVLILVGCESKESSSNKIRVGIISGPEIAIVQAAKKVALAKYGLNVEIIEFNEYTMPNAALSDGSLDANAFQHQPYLDASIKANKYDLVAIGKTFIYPMGVYSTKIKNLYQMPDKAIVAIPNDPSNEARALLILSKTGLISLKPGVGTNATPLDIKENPKHLQIKEIDAAQIPRVLSDVTLGIINDDYAIPAGFSHQNALYIEEKNSPYANLIVVRAADLNNPKLKQFVEAMHSPEVIKAAIEISKGGAVQAW